MASNLSGTNLGTMRALFTAGTVGGLTDGQLLERFTTRGGEDAELAFASLVERHGPMVLRVCRTVLHDAHDAEDAFQATFLILTLKAESVRGGASLSAWLHSVAFNVAATARSAVARRRSHEFKAGRTRSLAFTEDAPDDLGPVIHEELDRIPERYRAVLVLCYLEGSSQQQAAQRLGWPLGTVQSRLARGRDRLRARLVRRGLAPSAAILMSPLSSDAVQLAVPTALANSTVRLALTIGAARALAIQIAHVSAVSLARRVVSTMFVNKALTTSVAAILAAGVIATGAAFYHYQAAKPDSDTARLREVLKREGPAVANDDDGLLTVTGVVRLRGGLPAVAATVRSFAGSDEVSTVTHTDAAGRFQLKAVFAQLSLRPPVPLRIRVIDVDGRPVGGSELAVSVRTKDSGWIDVGRVEATHVRTDADGTAIVPWAPREELRGADVKLIASGWKVDETDLKQFGTGKITVHVRRETTVQGRLVMSVGGDAQGILVKGCRFNAWSRNAENTYTRARRDGTFRLRVPSDQGYVLGIDDLHWASDPWSGVVLGKDSVKSAEITMKVYPATTLMVRVTSGPKRKPVVNAVVHLERLGGVNWTDDSGKPRSGTSGVPTWLTTNANGVARAAVGTGAYELRLRSGNWNEIRKVHVTSEKPVDVEFHRSNLRIDRPLLRAGRFDVGVAVPRELVVHAARVNLDEANAALDEAASDQTLARHVFALGIADAIKALDVLGLRVDLDRLRGRRLHADRLTVLAIEGRLVLPGIDLARPAVNGQKGQSSDRRRGLKFLGRSKNRSVGQSWASI
jgi:RNA polymerase sigma factor (sigma-70 family)